jgi:hypothetical protein
MVCYTMVFDYITTTRYCTVMELHTDVQDYIVVSLEIVLHYIVVVLQIFAWDYTMAAMHC